MESYQYHTAGDKQAVPVPNKSRTVTGSHVFLRFVAVAMSLAAAVVLGLAKQSTTVAISLVPSMPPVNVPVTAKWNYLSAFVFFVVANAIACVHAAISLVLVTLENKGIAILVVVGDLVMVALLFSSIGAAGGIGLMGYKGNSHVQWKKVCNVFDHFCRQGAIALGLSGVAALVFFMLVVLATLNNHKKH